MAVRSTQCQNKAVRSTQGGRGVSPSLVHRFVCQEIFTVKQPKDVKIISFSEGDRSCRTKPSVPGSSQVMNT